LKHPKCEIKGKMKMKEKQDIEKCYENLSDAIIKRAVKDYRKAKKKKNTREVEEIRRFFRSDWFTDLTGLDGDWMIYKLDGEAHRRYKKCHNYNADDGSCRVLTRNNCFGCRLYRRVDNDVAGSGAG
jgi:hypothetical protein